MAHSREKRSSNSLSMNCDDLQVAGQQGIPSGSIKNNEEKGCPQGQPQEARRVWLQSTQKAVQCACSIREQGTQPTEWSAGIQQVGDVAQQIAEQIACSGDGADREIHLI